MTPRWKARLAAASLALMRRTSPRPLGPVWRWLYGRVVRAAARGLHRGWDGISVYLRGSLARSELRPGSSDVDVVAVIDEASPGAPSRTDVLRRWNEIRRRKRLLSVLADLVVYPRTELARQVADTILTYGLDGDGPRSVHSRSPRIPVDLVLRPGLYGPAEGWSLLAGPDVLPPRPSRERHEVLTAAWLELLYWWRHAASLCSGPSQMRAVPLSVKLVVEPARTWLWAARGLRASGAGETLDLAARELPEERGFLDVARRAAERPPRGEPLALGPVMAWLVRISVRLAGEMTRAAGPDQEVALVGSLPGDLPLLDWPALCMPARPDETFELRGGDPGDPGAVEASAAASAGWHHVTLRSDDLLVRPVAGDWARSLMRTVACPVTDPVSFAVLAGRRAAMYPSMPGWSAGDVARRAVAEHAASLTRLGEERGPVSPWRVLAAARAAMFEATVRAGRPQLAVRGHDALTWLAEEAGAPSLASRSPEELAAAARGSRPDRGLIDLWNAVRTLDAFAG